VFAPDQVNRLGKLKKAEIASEAERLAAGTGWLPVMFRGQEAAGEVETEAGREVGVDADVSSDASGSADSEVHEDVHAAV
jgi:ParB family chromosome partitioning protein